MNILPYLGTYAAKITVNEGACLSATAAVNIIYRVALNLV